MSFKSQYFNFSEPMEDYTLIKNNMPNIEYQVLSTPLVETGKNKSKKTKKTKTNTFPLAWTCYKKNNEWVCPMRGD